MTPLVEAGVTILTAVVGLAIISVLVSRKAQTPQVIQSAASGFGNILGVAESPVTGAGYGINLSYPGQDFSVSFGHA
jgi:hypothetical protein